MNSYSRLVALLVFPLLSSCAKEIENMNVITTPVGGTVSFKITGSYIHGPQDFTTSEVEAISFTSKKLGAYKNATGGFTVFLEKEEAGQAKAQVMLSFSDGATFSSLHRSQVVLLPGKNKSQVVYNQMEGYTSSVTNLVVGDVGKKVTGTFQFNAPKANPVDRSDVYSIKGTFECNRLPDSE